LTKNFKDSNSGDLPVLIGKFKRKVTRIDLNEVRQSSFVSKPQTLNATEIEEEDAK
jgi:hypothetical protein